MVLKTSGNSVKVWWWRIKKSSRFIYITQTFDY